MPWNLSRYFQLSFLPLSPRKLHDCLANYPLSCSCLSFLALAGLAPILAGSQHDQFRILQLGLVGLCVCVWLMRSDLLKETIQQYNALPRLYHSGFLAILSLGLISALVSRNPLPALAEPMTYTLLALLALTLALEIRQPQTEQVFIRALSLIAALIIAKLFFYYLLSLTINITYNPYLLFMDFGNVRFFGQIQTLLIPILCIPLIQPATRKKPWCFLLVSAWFALAFYGGNRGTLFALGFATLITLGLFGQLALGVSIRLLMCALSGCLISAIMVFCGEHFATTLAPVDNITRLFNRDAPFLNGRWPLWTIAIEQSLQHPLLGIGPGGFYYLQAQLGTHPHNIVLQLACEWGIPATVLAATLGLLCLLRWHKKIQSKKNQPDNNSATHILLFISILGGTIHGTVSGVFIMPIAQTLFAICCGWALGLYLRDCTTARNPAPNLVMMKALILIGFSALIAGAYQLHDQEHQTAGMNNPKNYPAAYGLRPRFWDQ